MVWKGPFVMVNKQGRIPKAQRCCVQCGATEGLTAVTLLFYPGKGRKVSAKSSRSVVVCEQCVVCSFVGTVAPAFGAALMEQLRYVYKRTVEASN